MYCLVLSYLADFGREAPYYAYSIRGAIKPTVGMAETVIGLVSAHEGSTSTDGRLDTVAIFLKLGSQDSDCQLSHCLLRHLLLPASKWAGWESCQATSNAHD